MTDITISKRKATGQGLIFAQPEVSLSQLHELNPDPYSLLSMVITDNKLDVLSPVKYCRRRQYLVGQVKLSHFVEVPPAETAEVFELSLE